MWVVYVLYFFGSVALWLSLKSTRKNSFFLLFFSLTWPIWMLHEAFKLVMTLNDKN